MRAIHVCWSVLLAGVAGTALAQAQPDLTVDQMIRELRPAAVTRGLSRNLVVSPAAVSKPESNGIASDEPAREQRPVSPSLSLLIRFDSDSDKVRPESLATIDKLAGALTASELDGARFLIEGHTDAAGKAAYNLKLSERRASAVKRLLVAKGVEPGRLRAVGKGSSEPANPADPRAAENRRVRIVNVE